MTDLINISDAITTILTTIIIAIGSWSLKKISTKIKDGKLTIPAIKLLKLNLSSDKFFNILSLFCLMIPIIYALINLFFILNEATDPVLIKTIYQIVFYIAYLLIWMIILAIFHYSDTLTKIKLLYKFNSLNSNRLSFIETYLYHIADLNKVDREINELKKENSKIEEEVKKLKTQFKK